MAGASDDELPVDRAFVVQFSRASRLARGRAGGRIEHISSGRSARFASPEELMRALAVLMDEVCPPHEAPPAPGDEHSREEEP